MTTSKLVRTRHGSDVEPLLPCWREHDATGTGPVQGAIVLVRFKTHFKVYGCKA